MTGDQAGPARKRPFVVLTALVLVAALVLTSAWVLVGALREDCVEPLASRPGTSGVIVKFRAVTTPLDDRYELAVFLGSVGCATGVELSVERPLAIEGVLLLRTAGALTPREMVIVVRAFEAEDDVEYAAPDEEVDATG